ncbi:unnamed protein product, partial [marine sediment metagenome]
PRAPFSDQEIGAIEAYLEQRDGRLLVMVDSSVALGGELDLGGLLSFLRSYGVQARVDAVGARVITGFTLTGRKASITELSVPVMPEGYAPHPVAADLGSYTVQFRWAAPLVAPAPEPQSELEVGPILTGVSSSWGETSTARDLRLERYDPEVDVAGPIVLGMVVGPSSAPGPYGLPVQDTSDMGGLRIIVFGSSLSFVNGVVDQLPGNLYLALNAVNWLVGKKHLLGIPPKDVDINRLVMSEAQVRTAKWLFIGLVPAAFVALGTTVWLFRRR